MFDFSKFVFDAVKCGINTYNNYHVKILAANYYSMGVLTDVQMAELDELLSQNKTAEELYVEELENENADLIAGMDEMGVSDEE